MCFLADGDIISIVIRAQLATRNVSILQNPPNCFWGSLVLPFNVNLCSFSGLMRPGLTIHLNLMPRFRTTGAVDVPPTLHPIRNHDAQGQTYTCCAYRRHQIKPDRFCKQLFMNSSHNTTVNCPDCIIYFLLTTR